MSINRTPKNWGAEELTSSDLDTEVKGLWDGLQAAWTAFTPVWVNSVGGAALSIGDGSLTGAYRQVGKTIEFRIFLERGSSTDVGSSYYAFEFPVTPVDDACFVGAANVWDASTTTHYACVASSNPGSDQFVVIVASSNAPVSSSAPIPWATSDRILISGSYEAA